MEHVLESQQFTEEVLHDLFKKADELREKPTRELQEGQRLKFIMLWEDLTKIRKKDENKNKSSC